MIEQWSAKLREILGSDKRVLAAGGGALALVLLLIIVAVAAGGDDGPDVLGTAIDNTTTTTEVDETTTTTEVDETTTTTEVDATTTTAAGAATTTTVAQPDVGGPPTSVVRTTTTAKPSPTTTIVYTSRNERSDNTYSVAVDGNGDGSGGKSTPRTNSGPNRLLFDVSATVVDGVITIIVDLENADTRDIRFPDGLSIDIAIKIDGATDRTVNLSDASRRDLRPAETYSISRTFSVSGPGQHVFDGSLTAAFANR